MCVCVFDFVTQYHQGPRCELDLPLIFLAVSHNVFVLFFSKGDLHEASIMPEVEEKRKSDPATRQKKLFNTGLKTNGMAALLLLPICYYLGIELYGYIAVGIQLVRVKKI